MRHAERAAELFVQGYSCAQAVFGAFTDITGMDFDLAMRLSAPFGAGMGRMREVCGACSAMFMVVGAVAGYSEADAAQKAAHYELIQELANRFKERNGTLICRELLQGLKTDTRPVPDARTAEYYKARPCLRFVTDAADILDNWLTERKAECTE